MTFREALGQLMQFDGQHVGVHVLAYEVDELAFQLSTFGRLKRLGEGFTLNQKEYEFLPPSFSIRAGAFVDAEWNPARDTLTFHLTNFDVLVQRTP